jgi:hypothetical protein
LIDRWHFVLKGKSEIGRIRPIGLIVHLCCLYAPMSFLHPGFATAFELANRAESLAVWTKAVLFKDQVKSQGKKKT